MRARIGTTEYEDLFDDLPCCRAQRRAEPPSRHAEG